MLIDTKMSEFSLAEGLLYVGMSVQIDPLSRTYRACFAILSMWSTLSCDKVDAYIIISALE